MAFLGNFTEKVILNWDQNSYDYDLTGQKKVSWIAGQLRLCLKPFAVFFNSVEDWSWEIAILRSIVEQSVTVEIDQIFVRESSETKLICLTIVELWIWCSIQFP